MLRCTAAVPFQVHVPRHTCGASLVPARRGAQWYAHDTRARARVGLSVAWLPSCCCVLRALFRMRMCGALHCDDAAALRAGAAKLIIALQSVVIGCTRRCEPCRGEHDAGGSHGDGTAARCARSQPPPLHAAAMGRLACACSAAQGLCGVDSADRLGALCGGFRFGRTSCRKASSSGSASAGCCECCAVPPVPPWVAPSDARWSGHTAQRNRSPPAVSSRNNATPMDAVVDSAIGSTGCGHRVWGVGRTRVM